MVSSKKVNHKKFPRQYVYNNRDNHLLTWNMIEMKTETKHGENLNQWKAMANELSAAGEEQFT